MATDVVCLSHLRWGFVYQRPNHLMSRCGQGHRVFFVEEPVMGDGPVRMELRTVAPNVVTAVPHLKAGTPAESAVATQRELLEELLRRFDVSAPLLWFYTPMALPFARHIDAAGVVFDCMDELSGFQGAPPELLPLEQELFDRADVVFTGGESLYRAKRLRHPNVHCFPSSVDAAHFAAAREATTVPPGDQQRILRPRLGFFGVIDERLDRDLVASLAGARPDYQVVLVGPVVKIEASTLPHAPNIHYLGARRYEELPAYMAGWDVGIMPFARNDATRFISPTKTLEYLAAGLPVVSTPIRDVVHPYGDRGVVAIGDGASFVAAVDDALAARGTPAAAARRAAADAVVAGTSWDSTWTRMYAHLEPLLGTGRKVA